VTIVRIGIALAAAALAVAACGAPPPPTREAGHVVYLAFARGDEGVTLGADDDATTNVSRVCGTARFDAWTGAPMREYCGDRDACRRAIRDRVASYFAGLDVAFVIERPAAPPYTMVVVAPPNEDCTFGRRGVAFADCDDANPSSVAFAFDCDGDPDACAVLVAHETAHTFGLVHVVDDRDVMIGGPSDPSLAFQEDESAATDNDCGVTSQSSARALRHALGPAR
jgi:hypothetical protein